MSEAEVTREEAAGMLADHEDHFRTPLHMIHESGLPSARNMLADRLRLLRSVVALHDENDRLRQAIRDAEQAILGGDTPTATDRMLHAALSPLWAVMSRE